jgi:hypothetical protein
VTAAKKGRTPTKTEVAAALGKKIDAHLRRIEGDLALNPPKRFDATSKAWVLDPAGMRAYYGARARGDRYRVWVIYVSFQGGSYMSIEDAETYLAWLDAGNVGRHFEALRERQS